MIYDVDFDSGFKENCVTCQRDEIGFLNEKQVKLENANKCSASMAKTILNTGETAQIFQANRFGGPRDDWDIIIWGSVTAGGIHGSGGIIIHGGDDN